MNLAWQSELLSRGKSTIERKPLINQVKLLEMDFSPGKFTEKLWCACLGTVEDFMIKLDESWVLPDTAELDGLV